MAVLLICSACGKSNQPPSRFCISCGVCFEQAADAYTTEPLDPSIIVGTRNITSKQRPVTSFLSQALGWELDCRQRDEIDVVMHTLAEAVALWQWLWYFYGQHPAPEGRLETSLPQLLAQLIENNRVRQEALHNLLMMELRSHR